jgi:tRNA 2-thiouridine synthesizing protein A
MSSGTILTVETSDPLAIIDIPHFCNENGHALLTSEKTGNGHRFTIRKT